VYEVKDYNYADAIELFFDDDTGRRDDIRATFEPRPNGTHIVFIDARGYQVPDIPDGVDVVQRFLGALPRTPIRRGVKTGDDFFVPISHTCTLSVHGVERFRLVSLSNLEHVVRHVVELTSSAPAAVAEAADEADAISLLVTARDCSAKALEAARAFLFAANDADTALAARAAAKAAAEAAHAECVTAIDLYSSTLAEDRQPVEQSQ